MKGTSLNNQERSAGKPARPSQFHRGYIWQETIKWHGLFAPSWMSHQKEKKERWCRKVLCDKTVKKDAASLGIAWSVNWLLQQVSPSQRLSTAVHRLSTPQFTGLMVQIRILMSTCHLVSANRPSSESFLYKHLNLTRKALNAWDSFTRRTWSEYLSDH